MTIPSVTSDHNVASSPGSKFGATNEPIRYISSFIDSDENDSDIMQHPACEILDFSLSEEQSNSDHDG